MLICKYREIKYFVFAKLGRMKNIKAQVGKSFFAIMAGNRIWIGF
jgi:hypothetical protein